MTKAPLASPPQAAQASAPTSARSGPARDSLQAEAPEREPTRWSAGSFSALSAPADPSQPRATAGALDRLPRPLVAQERLTEPRPAPAMPGIAEVGIRQSAAQRAVRPVLVQRKRADEATASPRLPAPAQGSGRPMPRSVQAKMERSFHADFSAVRIHEGPQAHAVGALAYTQGADIHFAPGQYQPESRRGQELLGHELTHVVQQARGRVRAPQQAARVPINDDAGLEREADAMGARAARGEPVSSGLATSAPRVAAGQQPRRPDMVLAYAVKGERATETPILQRKRAYGTELDGKETWIAGTKLEKESNGAYAIITPSDQDTGTEADGSGVVAAAARKIFEKPTFDSGHMLSWHLGGPNAPDNLSAITRSQNQRHRNQLEKQAIDAIKAGNTIAYCTVVTQRANIETTDGTTVAENLAYALEGNFTVLQGPDKGGPKGSHKASIGPNNLRMKDGRPLKSPSPTNTSTTCETLAQNAKNSPAPDSQPGLAQEVKPSARRSKERPPVKREAKDKGGKQEKAGPVTLTAEANPTFEFTFDRPKELGKLDIASPPLAHPGIRVTNVNMDLGEKKEQSGDGEKQEVLAFKGGAITTSVDMGGAVSSSGEQRLELVPDEASPKSPDVVHSLVKRTGEHHVGGLTSKLDDFFQKRVTTSADLTDEGMQATLKVSAGPLGTSGLQLQESSIAATLGKDGLKLAGNVGISDAAERIKGNLGVAWSDSGLTVTGSATVKDVISGLEPVEAKITYDSAANGLEGLSLDIEKVAYKKTIGAIPFTGEAKALHYDFKTGGFSGDARLTGDLGTLGQVTATTKIADNALQRADLAYEKTPIELPKQNPIFTGNLESHLTYEKEALSGTIGGSATLKLPALQKLGKGDQPITMSVDAGITGGAVGGKFTLQTPVQLGPYFRVTELGATLSKEGGFGMSGGLELESGIFQPARVGISYQNGKLSGSGEVGIAKGKIVGVDAATITVGIDGDKISGKGTLTPAVRQIQQGAITFSYSPAAGISFGGSLALAGGIPYLKSAAVDFLVGKRPGAASYNVSAGGTLAIAMPGLEASAKASYANGAFTIEGKAPYKAGKLVSGNVMVGVTNRVIDPQGKPTDQVGEALAPYGHGSVTIALTPWLQGTAGIRLLPNGEIEVSGQLAIPKPKEFFAKKGFKKKLLSIGFDIPILGFAVAGQRVGIFATVGGDVTFDASVGPGTLRDTKLSVTYNHARPEQTKIGGRAAIKVPARAGVRVAIRGALGVGIPIVSASLGLEASGRLGIDGALNAGINLAWTPTGGLSFDALGKISAQPKLTFDLTGFAVVEADLLIKKLELYRKNWKLASFQYGPDMRLGMSFPIHYDAKKGLEMSWDKVKFEEPKFDAKSLLKGLVDKAK
jgi:Domain of unknown function (DUF4157)